MVFLVFLVPSQGFIGSLLVFLVPFTVFVLSQLPHVVLELESLKTLVFLVFLAPSQRFIGSVLVFVGTSQRFLCFLSSHTLS